MVRINFYRPSYKKSAINAPVNAQIGDKSATNNENDPVNCPVNCPANGNDPENCTVNCTVNDDCPVNCPVTAKETYLAIKENPRLSIHELSKKLGISERTVKNHQKLLKDADLIERIGADKNGYWKVIK